MAGISSCCLQNEEAPQPNTFDNLAQRQKMVLGKQLENPYSVANMKLALENIRGKTNGRTAEDDFEIETTHYYVRFNVTNGSNISTLEADSLFLFEYPLDYEISEGDYYEDKTEDGYWMYTSVPVGYEFTAIEYEILENLFLPEEVETNGRLTGFFNELEEEALKITGNFEEADTESTNGRRRINPQGFIRVWGNRNVNGQAIGLVPVRGIIVQTRRWFYTSRTYINNDGFYRSNRGYKRDPNYKIIFQNWRGFKIWNTVIDINVASMDLGRHSRNGYSFNILQNSKTWPWATVNNATLAYLGHCAALGVSLPPSDLRIVARDKRTWSSTPMLRRTWGRYGLTTHSQLANYLLNANSLVFSANALATITKFTQPDLIISAPKSGINGNETRRAYNMIFHEMAHASHWSLVGSSYWIKYINYIITYGSYGDGTGANAGYCGVGEMWGNYFGNFVVANREGNGTFVDGVTWDPGENWFNPGFLWRCGGGGGSGINDITVGGIYGSIRATSFNSLINNLQLRTTRDNEVDIAFNFYPDWP